MSSRWPGDSDVVLLVEGLGKRYSAAEAGRYAPASAIFGSRRRRRDADMSAGDFGGDFDVDGGDDDVEDDATDLPVTSYAPGATLADWAVRDVSFELSRGRVLGIYGGAGAGKTTLIRLLAGVVPPSEGRAVVRGITAPLYEVAQTFMLADRSVAANISYIGRVARLGRRERAALADDVAQMLELSSEALRGPTSKGMMERVALALACHPQADLLLLDEPPLDGAGLRWLEEAIGRGAAAVIASADLATLQRFADDIIRLGRDAGGSDATAPDTGKDVGRAPSAAGFAPGDRAAWLTHVDPPFIQAAGLMSVDVLAETATDAATLACIVELPTVAARFRVTWWLTDEQGRTQTFSQPEPLPLLSVGRHRVTTRLPHGALESGSYEVDVRVKLREPLSGAIARARQGTLDIVDPDHGRWPEDLELDAPEDEAGTPAPEWGVTAVDRMPSGRSG